MIKQLSYIFMCVFLLGQLGVGYVEINASEISNNEIDSILDGKSVISKDSLSIDEEFLDTIPDEELITGYYVTDTEKYDKLENLPDDLQIKIFEELNHLDQLNLINESNTLDETYITYNDDTEFIFSNEEGNIILNVLNYTILLTQNDYVETIGLEKTGRSTYKYVTTKYVKNTSWQRVVGVVAFVGGFIPGYGKVVSIGLSAATIIGSYVQVEKYGIQKRYVNTEKSCDWKYITKWYTYNNYTGYINTTTSYMKTSQYC